MQGLCQTTERAVQVVHEQIRRPILEVVLYNKS